MSGPPNAAVRHKLLVSAKASSAFPIEIAHISLDKYSLVIKSFVDRFLRRNRFSEQAPSCRLDQSTALRHIVYAIGSMQLVTNSHDQHQPAMNEALQAYRMSCSTLRSQLETVSMAEYIAAIQTTMLMGMFEVRSSHALFRRLLRLT